MADKQRVYYHVTFQPYKRLHALYDEVEQLFLDMMPTIARQVGFNFIVVRQRCAPTTVEACSMMRSMTVSMVDIFGKVNIM